MSYIHDMYDERNIEIDNVGICNYQLPIIFKSRSNYNTISKIICGVSLKENVKGAHLSRIIEVLDEMVASKEITINYLNCILKEKAYENPKFSEDLVRDTLIALKKYYSGGMIGTEIENLESIHQHNVYARGLVR